MKQFSIEEYIKNPNRKVITRDGRNVTIHCTNYCIKPIIAEIEGLGYSYSCFADGVASIEGDDACNDLFFVTEKHEGWQNIYKSVGGNIRGSIVWPTKEEAERNANTSPTDLDKLVATIKIEWEE